MTILVSLNSPESEQFIETTKNVEIGVKFEMSYGLCRRKGGL